MIRCVERVFFFHYDCGYSEVANDVVNSGRGRSGEESVNRARCQILKGGDIL